MNFSDGDRDQSFLRIVCDETKCRQVGSPSQTENLGTRTTRFHRFCGNTRFDFTGHVIHFPQELARFRENWHSGRFDVPASWLFIVQCISLNPVVRLFELRVIKMIRIRSWVWRDTVCCMIALTLIGCGSDSNSGTTTPVNSSTTVATNGSNTAPSGAGMQMMGPPMGGAPQLGMTPPGSMPGMSGAPGSPPGMSSQMAGAPGLSGGTPGAAGGPPGMNMDPAAMMRASGMTPGGAPGAPGMTSPGGPPGMTPPGGAPPGAGMRAPNPDSMRRPDGAGGPGAMGGAPGGAGMRAPNPDSMRRPDGAGGPGAMGGAPGAPGAMSRTPGGGAMGGPGGMAGGPGAMGGPGGGGSQAGNFSPGSVDDTLQKFCTAMADGDTAAAAEYIFPKVKGLAGQIREGELSDDKIEEITNALSPLTELQPSGNPTNTKRMLRNKKNQVLSFVLKKDKEDDTFKITEFSISKPKRYATPLQC